MSLIISIGGLLLMEYLVYSSFDEGGFKGGYITGVICSIEMVVLFLI